MILQLSDGRAIMWLTLLLLEWVTLIRLNDGAKRIRPNNNQVIQPFYGGSGSNGPPHILLLYDVQNEMMANQSNTSFVVNACG